MIRDLKLVDPKGCSVGSFFTISFNPSPGATSYATGPFDTPEDAQKSARNLTKSGARNVLIVETLQHLRSVTSTVEVVAGE